MTEYKDPYLERMRELFFAGDLTHDMMELQDYERLMSYEMNSDEHNVFIIEFCIDGLQKSDKYNYEMQKRPFEEIAAIVKKEHMEARLYFFRHAVKSIGRYLGVAVLLFSALQIMGLLSGFNLLSDLRDSVNKFLFSNKIEEEYFLSLTPAENFIEGNGEEAESIEFKNLAEVEEKLRRLISPHLLNNYVFKNAIYSRNAGKEKITFNFTDNNSNKISLAVHKQFSFSNYSEKQENDIADIVKEEIYKGAQNDFKIVKNTSNYRVEWQYDKYYLYMEAYLPIDEVKMILENYY